MGQCYAKNPHVAADGDNTAVSVSATGKSPVGCGGRRSSRPSPARSSAAWSPWAGTPLPEGIAASSTPWRFFRRSFPPPSPEKHIMESLARPFVQHSPASAAQTPALVKLPLDGPIPEHGCGKERELYKSFGYDPHFAVKYELGKEMGRGRFGHTFLARARKGDELRSHLLAVKTISIAKMTTAIAIEDVRREVKILKALSGHSNFVKFYDACFVKVESY